ncbi:valine--tRNA ligase [Phocaeicola plebeius]|jgi:valyl-tRNA synthetase|uniref:Valine--tRNA ligase n=1 Tax=Phocaeicola plebeius TaxID=310297 RepID=A0A3E4N713_9BACT|nr:valine--tRNA ligase [Phocaeicola plebeius]RGK57580.1 valine--tRNA ligase [Phocaeicola plebeius]RGM37591.1 valine--tRNA ligase [Phocaeicola plebeius]RGQ72077.1 valine--tRNA ligase [Phocaeicola plebeius]RGQ91408.1 valine--tRNA ligase [Phocaeicola plebeius]RGZ53333.1 valine--tRNA ligase [Phocaeicola plebeius]
MELASKYNPADVEGKWYQYWLDHKLFSSKPDGREPYTVVIPPPNVTGVLHMGHMLNNTIQDILVRRARMMGKNACWVPGTDHASIATEAKVVNRLAQQGIKKTDLTREEFLKHAWAWTEEHGGIILKQLRKLGASCDWDRTAFTMDETRSKSVIKVFVDLYNKGLIYRGVRMVNWDPKALTALSDEEVIYKEEHSKLYYLRYYVADDDMSGETGAEGEIVHRDAQGRRYAVVATTRPETIMGDTAMCINPADPKNQWLKGKKVIVPLVGRVIPVIEDSYVDIEFGTGCLKVTPAHDVNDYMLGEKYNLPSIDIFNDNGTLSEAAGLYVGMDRFDVRAQIEKDLDAAGLLEKVEAYTNKVGFSERTNVAIEPKLSMQWFLKMQHFADMALPPVMNDELKFYPAKYKNTYRNWLENIKDWCISRQLWWGHRIPAYYLPKGGFVVAETPEQALELAKEKTGDANLKMEDLRQEDDCLDTWFSSWLWPISLFDGINNPSNEEIKYYYPTADLVTGPDIIFFWVARMIMAGYEYMGDMPFRNVYFTGIVRDKIGRKMSKSLGNSPDPLELIEQFGADGVRMGMMLAAPAGNDILFDEALCEQGRNFNNKIWNAFRLVKGWQVADIKQPEYAKLATEWFDSMLAKTAEEVNDLFGKYRLSEALMAVYKLFWDEFSSWYLEMVKPAYGQPIDKVTYEKTLAFFETLLKLLHPFMPFITEELWQHIYDRQPGESIMTQTLVKDMPYNETLIAQFEAVKEVISGIRTIRLQKNIAQKEALALEVTGENPVAGFGSVIAKLCNLSEIKQVETKSEGAAAFMVGTTEYAVPLGNLINVEEELKKLEADLKYQEGFLQSVMKKLSNEKFVSKAPANVIEMERKKQADAETKIAALKESIAALKR